MTITDEMVEAAARALWGFEHGPAVPFEVAHPTARAIQIEKARAALEAALEAAPKRPTWIRRKGAGDEEEK